MSSSQPPSLQTMGQANRHWKSQDHYREGGERYHCRIKARRIQNDIYIYIYIYFDNILLILNKGNKRIVYLTRRDKICRQIIIIEIKRHVGAYSKLCCCMSHRVAYPLNPTKTKTKTRIRDTNNITNDVTYGPIRWEVSRN